MSEQESNNKQDRPADDAEAMGAAQDGKRAQGASDIRDVTEGPRGSALEVAVEHNIEKAMKILKRKLIKEGLFKELKLRRYYEKPSEKRKRKLKESLKKLRKEESRAKKNALL